MNTNLKGVWKQMRKLGLGALAHANRHAAYWSYHNDYLEELSVLQAAHAGELLIKSRIAQEHPLLIFDQIPRSEQSIGDKLDLEDLFSKGQTIQWSNLPERLWATTGLYIPDVELFRKFGKLRNGIQHFAPPDRKSIGQETLEFIYGVIDPFINNCWNLFAIDYDEDDEPYIYYLSALVSREITFLVSPEAAKCYNDWNVDWENVNLSYKNEMIKRVKKALENEMKK